MTDEPADPASEILALAAADPGAAATACSRHFDRVDRVPDGHADNLLGVVTAQAIAERTRSWAVRR